MVPFKVYIKEDSDFRQEALAAFTRLKSQLTNDIRRRTIFDSVVPLEDGYIAYATSLGLSNKYKDLIIYFAHVDKISPLIKINKDVPQESFGFFKNKPVIILPCVTKEDDLYKLNLLISKNSFVGQFTQYLEFLDGEPEIRV